MTKEKYLRMCEQLGKEPSAKETPPDIQEDFPEIVTIAFSIFNRLGDKIVPDLGFAGKDYTNLPIYIDIYDIDKHQIEFFLDIITYLEGRAISKSAERAKKEMDKLKRK